MRIQHKNQSDTIKVSIIIPVYNAEKYIERSVKSAMRQTLKEIEIILINDGSTDDTLKIVESLSTLDNRIIIINQKNCGTSAARHRGIKISRGEYLFFLDGDDWVEKTACERKYQFAKKENLDIVITDFYRDYDNGNIELWKDLKSKKVFYSVEEYLMKFFKRKSYRPLWNKLYSRALFGETDFSQYRGPGQDFVMNAIVIPRAKKIGKLHEAFYHYILNPNSVRRNMTPELYYQQFGTHNFIKKIYMDDGIYDIYKEGFERNKLLAMYSFLKKKPSFGNEFYEACLEECLKYFESKPKIYSDLGLSRRLKVLFLKQFPRKENIVRVILFNNRKSN